MKNQIENTARTVRDNPMLGLLTGLPGGIEASESRGQQQLLASTVLPVKGSESKELAALGFKFGERVEGDELFRDATLPEGWKREGSDHAMWSYIVDERGIRRVAIFYKAAFYDRDAFMRTVDVGGDLATTAIYGDDDITPDSLNLSLLSPEELSSLRARLKDCDETSKYRHRAKLALKVIRETLSSRSTSRGE